MNVRSTTEDPREEVGTQLHVGKGSSHPIDRTAELESRRRQMVDEMSAGQDGLTPISPPDVVSQQECPGHRRHIAHAAFGDTFLFWGGNGQRFVQDAVISKVGAQLLINIVPGIVEPEALNTAAELGLNHRAEVPNGRRDGGLRRQQIGPRVTGSFVNKYHEPLVPL